MITFWLAVAAIGFLIVIEEQIRYSRMPISERKVRLRARQAKGHRPTNARTYLRRRAIPSFVVLTVVGALLVWLSAHGARSQQAWVVALVVVAFLALFAVMIVLGYKQILADEPLLEGDDDERRPW